MFDVAGWRSRTITQRREESEVGFEMYYKFPYAFSQQRQLATILRGEWKRILSKLSESFNCSTAQQLGRVG